jgi:hypothetical protein
LIGKRKALNYGIVRLTNIKCTKENNIENQISKANRRIFVIITGLLVLLDGIFKWNNIAEIYIVFGVLIGFGLYTWWYYKKYSN